MNNPAPRSRPARTLLLAIFAFLGALATNVSVSFAASPAPLHVAATIKPVQSLVALVMAGVGEPDLLVAGADSPHTHAVRPSEARSLAKADLVFWIGPTMETSFVKPIATLVQGKVVSFLKAPGVTVLPVRPAGNLPQDFAAAEAADHEHEAGAPDPHIWLDPENAVAMLRVIGKELEAADPANAATYGANAAAAEQRIAALETELGAELAPVKQIPFIPYHDAYQYIERRYGLTAVAAVTLSPEQAPGAKRIEALRKLIKDRNVACVFTEPEFEPAIVRTVVEGTPAKIAVLDPEGAQIPGGPDFYFTLMRQVGRDLTGCLSPSAR